MNGSERKPSAWKRFIAKLNREFRWFMPGLGYKRWIVLTIIGAMLLGLGLAVIVLEYYRTTTNEFLTPILAALSLRFLDRPIRFLLFGGLGFAMILIGIWGANRAVLKPFEREGRPAWEAVQQYRRKDRGIKVVVIGGGHGLSSLLSGIKAYTHNITAIVTVSDDGGSSGELRRDMGVLPPGDIRNCLSALSNDEALLSQVFQYRFKSGAGLEGHSLGNLFITALAEITGSFEEAVAESGRVLAIYGKVLPSTLSNVQLVGDVRLQDSQEIVQVKGESKITEAGGKILRVLLEPSNAQAYPPTVAAILNADLIVVGPGSLYTSLLPNLLVSDLVDAMRSSRAEVFYVSNVATQRGETDGFNVSDHLHVLEQHVGKNLFDLVISNNNFKGELGEGVEWVRNDSTSRRHFKVCETDLVDGLYPWRHDSKKLAKAIINVFEERTGPLYG
jgi:uncharacterized cofD-like protein